MATKVRELADVTPSSSQPNPLISHDKLRQLYSTMLECRLLEERAQTLRRRAGIDDDHHSSLGMEATAVGAAIDLRPTDTLAPPHRDSILAYLKGTPVTAVLSQLYRPVTRPQIRRSVPGDGCSPLNIVLPISTVAGQLKSYTGIALASHLAKNGNVFVVFSVVGSISPSEWHDALNSAGRRSLPMIFVRHQRTNPSAGLASVKLETMRDDTSSATVDFGFPAIAVDGNDAVAVYRVAQEAIERARCGGGPTLIEAQTLPGHGPNEMNRAHHRTADEVEKREFVDPISAMERYLTGKALFSQSWRKEIVAAFQMELDAAVDAAENDGCGVSA